ncbi:MAG: sugar ABC transporter permease [Lachnospiraceae bacterium]|nr:sugar ABC transporter permease [Lachnospiraceae bacterium]
MTARKKKTITTNLWCWAFVSLTLIFYILFQGYPIICSVIYSLHDWSGMTPDMRYVGLANFKNLMKDAMFWSAFKNSFKYMAVMVPLEVSVSLLYACLLNSPKLKGKTFYRACLFLPVVITAAVAGIVMSFIFSTGGAVNYILTSLKIVDKAVNWMGNAKLAVAAVVLVSLWKDVGTYMLYWLAALQGVSKDIIEAAQLDGANSIKLFFYVTLPVIAPTAGVIVILCTINSLKAFDIIQTLTGGGPFFATDVIATYIYKMAFTADIGMPRFGYASAASLTFGFVVIIIGVILNLIKGKLQRKETAR